ncbi:MAG: thioredoxin [Gammaproteobacteria bacterium]|nr:thioredoxin [Gammaproteobacteria bacterium]
MTKPTWRAAPLSWGRGPARFEIFIEPTCPFSVKALGKLEALLTAAGEDRVTIWLRLQSQPWHLFSGVVTRCVLAASTLPQGRDAAWQVLQAVGAHREEFVLIDHATGPNREHSLNDVIRRIETLTGLALEGAFSEPALEGVIKWHAKYARQNGVHVSPTFMIDGMIQPQLGSGDEVSVWAAAIA